MSEHVKINGIWYRLAEDAEGTHYNMGLEPLRVPNAAVVQGTTGTFQLRPDQLLWTMTDWSGGEGQLKFNLQEPSRSYLLQGVDPFTRPGNLLVGFKEGFAQLQTGGDLTDDGLRIGQGYNTVWAISDDTQIAYEWDPANDYFKTGVDPGVGSGGVYGDSICGDYFLMFYVESGAGKIIKFDGSFAIHNDQVPFTTMGNMKDMGNYLYKLDTQNGKLYELSKAVANLTVAEVPLYEFNPGFPVTTGSNMVAADNRLYFFTNHGFTTVIHEVVPTTAAGTGYGRELARLEGIRSEAIWFSGGIVYFLGVDEEPAAATTVGPDRFVMYLQPEGSYGTLGSVRGLVRAPSDHGISPAHWAGFGMTAAASGRLTRTAFLIPPTSEDQDHDDVAQGIFEIDGVTGGYAAVARYPTTVTTRPTDERGLVFYDGRYFAFDDDLNKVHTWDVTAPSPQTGEYVSASHDFGLSSEKILERIEIVCEPLPNNGTGINVGYSLDGATWVDAEIVGTTGDVGGVLQISTDSSTKKFRSIQIRGQLVPSAGVGPVLKAVNVYARVNRKIKVWDLLLDVSDDAAPAGYNGAQLISNIVGLADNTVVDFVDKYRSHNPEDAGTTYDAVIDSGQVILSEQGEGFIHVRVTEVI